MDERFFTPERGRVTNGLGICEATEPVEVSTLPQNAGDHGWVLGIIERALAHIEQDIGWRSDDLVTFVRATSAKPMPLVHFFDRLQRKDRKTGARCVPWFSTRPGESRVGVRIGDRDVVVFSMAEPLYLEDDFPLAKAALRGREYVLLDRLGNRLASVDVDVVAGAECGARSGPARS